MRSLLPLLLLFLLACQDGEAPTPDSILGTWQLREVYIDPGDGSGDFVPATYDRTLTFFPDGTYVTTVPICTLGEREGEAGEGTYSEEEEVILPTYCRIGARYSYDITGIELTIQYWCIEGCAERYVKIRD